MAQNRWDARGWVIGILTVLVLSVGGYTVSSLAREVEGAKTQAESAKKIATELSERQAVDDERFRMIAEGMKELKASVNDVRELLIRTHMQELKKEKPLPNK